jgi:hypothetical protein
MIISSPALMEVIDGGNDVVVIVARYLVNGLPIGYQEALEVHLSFEHVGEQVFLGVHL